MFTLGATLGNLFASNGYQFWPVYNIKDFLESWGWTHRFGEKVQPSALEQTKTGQLQGVLVAEISVQSYPGWALKLIFSSYFQCLPHVFHDLILKKAMSGLSSLVKGRQDLWPSGGEVMLPKETKNIK